MEVFKLCLFIAGGTPNSTQALGNLLAFCETHLKGRHEIEVVDVFREPSRALAAGVFMTPTLLRLSPAPVLRIVGTLADPNVLRNVLQAESLAV